MVRGEEEGEDGGAGLGILFGSAMATATVKGTGVALCFSLNGHDYAVIWGLLLGTRQLDLLVRLHLTPHPPTPRRLRPPHQPGMAVGREGERVQNMGRCAPSRNRITTQAEQAVFSHLYPRSRERRTFPHPCRSLVLQGLGTSLPRAGPSSQGGWQEGAATGKSEKTPESGSRGADLHQLPATCVP